MSSAKHRNPANCQSGVAPKPTACHPKHRQQQVRTNQRNRQSQPTTFHGRHEHTNASIPIDRVAEGQLLRLESTSSPKI